MALARMLGRLTGGLAGAWRRKWWLLVPTAVMALVTVAGSYFFLPTRYRSASGIVIEKRCLPRLPISKPLRTTG